MSLTKQSTTKQNRERKNDECEPDLTVYLPVCGVCLCTVQSKERLCECAHAIAPDTTLRGNMRTAFVCALATGK